MTLIFRNKLYGFLTLSRFFSTIGSAMYNIVFVVFASQMSHASLAVSIANVVVVIPTIFTVFVGLAADRTQKKAWWLIALGFIQAVIFSLVAVAVHETTWFAFSAVCLCNVISDMLTDYTSGLRLPIIKKNIPEKDLVEAFSFTTVVAYVCDYAGQALGIGILHMSNNNFSFVALMNAFSYALASLVMVIIHRNLTHDPVPQSDRSISLGKQARRMMTYMRQIFDEHESIGFIRLLAAAFLVNGMSAAFSAIYNLSLLKSPIFSLSYSQSLVVEQGILVAGIVLGSLTPHDYFSRQSLTFLLICSSLSQCAVGLVNTLGAESLVGIVIYAFAGFVSGKINPKMSSLLMASLPADLLAQSSNFLSLLFTMAMPVGTIIFSALAAWNFQAAWIGFTLGSVLGLALCLNTRRRAGKTPADR